jgi:HD superfamily phosphodiesterase
MFECPGARKFRQPEPEFINCPFCKAEVEIWTDEFKTICPKCKKTVIRWQDASCLEWCNYAEECVGEQAYENYMKNVTVTLRDKLIKELEGYFGSDTKRINHAKKVMGYAEEILKKEQASWHIVIPASILHDVGIKVAEERYGSSAGHLQEKESPAVARKILLKLGISKERIDEICEIIACHHSPGKINTQNFKVLYDADWLVNLKDEVDTKDKSRLKGIIDKVFLTNTGKELAEKIYLREDVK